MDDYVKAEIRVNKLFLHELILFNALLRNLTLITFFMIYTVNLKYTTYECVCTCTYIFILLVFIEETRLATNT